MNYGYNMRFFKEAITKNAAVQVDGKCHLVYEFLLKNCMRCRTFERVMPVKVIALSVALPDADVLDAMHTLNKLKLFKCFRMAENEFSFTLNDYETHFYGLIRT